MRSPVPRHRPTLRESRERDPLTAISPPHHQGKQPERLPAPHTHHNTTQTQTRRLPRHQAPTDDRPAHTRPSKGRHRRQAGAREDAQQRVQDLRRARPLAPPARSETGSNRSRSSTPRQQEHQPTTHTPRMQFPHTPYRTPALCGKHITHTAEKPPSAPPPILPLGFVHENEFWLRLCGAVTVREGISPRLTVPEDKNEPRVSPPPRLQTSC